jgi:hypothetical protein
MGANDPEADELARQELQNQLWGTSEPEDGLVAPVDPSDMKSVHRMHRQLAQAVGSTGELTPGTRGVAIGLEAYKGVCSPGAGIGSIWYRVSMLNVCDSIGLLSKYKTDVGFIDVVYHVAATIPMKRMQTGVTYHGLPFDTEEFVKQVERLMLDSG